jgi:methanethiol oxidase
MRRELRSDRLRVEIGGEDTEHAVDVRQVGAVQLRVGGIVSRAAHPKRAAALNGGPQMVEVSRDGRRIYFTNSLYSAVDLQFYPEGLDGRMVKVKVKPDGGIELDRDFFINWPAGGHRPHQVRLQGGDASSDSYCYP